MERMTKDRFIEIKAKAAQIRAADKINEDARVEKYVSAKHLVESVKGTNASI